MSLMATQSWNDYEGYHYGLKEYDAFHWNLDVQYTPSDTARFNAFIGQQESEWSQLAREDHDPGVLDWRTDVDDDNLFAGVGVNVELIKDKLSLEGRYSYSSSEVDTMITDELGGLQVLPQNEVTRHIINLDLDWTYTDQLDFVVNYLYEDRDVENWAWDKTAYLADYAFGWAPQDFSVHYFTVGVRLAF